MSPGLALKRKFIKQIFFKTKYALFSHPQNIKTLVNLPIDAGASERVDHVVTNAAIQAGVVCTLVYFHFTLGPSKTLNEKKHDYLFVFRGSEKITLIYIYITSSD